jgi:hypothetical protein
VTIIVAKALGLDNTFNLRAAKNNGIFKITYLKEKRKFACREIVR